MDSRYFLTQADLGTSQNQVAGLWAQGLDGLVDEVAEAKYRHCYVHNPAGTGICLLLHQRASGSAVGVQGLIPRTFYAGARRIDAATLADFLVTPEHRSLGPALKLMRRCIALSKERFAFVYGTPNEKSIAILKRAGIRSIGALTRYTKVIHSESFWKTRLPGWMIPAAAATADAAIACADIGLGWLHGRHLRWSEQSEFGAKFESVWQGRDPETFSSERSAAMLRWRYASPVTGGLWHLSLATNRSSAPVGYVIWRQRNDNAMVSDFFYSSEKTSVRTLMRSFTRYVRQFPVDRISLEFFGHASIAEALTACGFVPRERNPVVFVERADDGQHAQGISPSTIFMTSFDRDHEE